MTARDVVIIGGGIAGGTLASVLARAGIDVMVLERQATYRDRVRGECMWQWGVAETQRLGLVETLWAAGGRSGIRLESYDEVTGPGATAYPVEDLGALIAGVDGTLNLYHPAATAALVEAAATTGAQIVRGVADVTIRAGSSPEVRWIDADGSHRVASRLVVGADGRGSIVRQQAGIKLRRDPVPHVAAGMLVDGLEDVDARTDLIARERDLMFFSFPQGGGRARLYLCVPTKQRDRFLGRAAAQRFLDAVGTIRCLPRAERWSRARPAGPCATFTCEDSHVDRVGVPGVVLIGDAGGYNNPLIGQGQSLAVRDAGSLADVLLADGLASQAGLEAYGAERTERLRRARIAALIEVWANHSFEVQDPEERQLRYNRAFSDEVLRGLMEGQMLGFESLEHIPSDSEARERLLATT